MWVSNVYKVEPCSLALFGPYHSLSYYFYCCSFS